ncbi:hypothetical protein [Micromonospora sp. NPDC049645]|uniref:hypothetical protein n=1 Tax=Micromonospora sp. NPDC049645 TaxID=3155508 RepID=UPI00342A40A9
MQTAFAAAGAYMAEVIAMSGRALAIRRVVDHVLADRDDAALAAMRALDDESRRQLVAAAATVAALQYEIDVAGAADPPLDDERDPTLPLHVAITHTNRAARALSDPIAGVDPAVGARTLAGMTDILAALADVTHELRARIAQSYPAAAQGRYTAAAGASAPLELRTSHGELGDVESHLRQLGRMLAIPQRTLDALSYGRRS